MHQENTPVRPLLGVGVGGEGREGIVIPGWMTARAALRAVSSSTKKLPDNLQLELNRIKPLNNVAKRWWRQKMLRVE